MNRCINKGLNKSLALVCVMLSGCGITPLYPPVVVDDKSGPAPKHIKDSGPEKDVNVDHVPSATPVHEMVTLAGNKSPYTVLGKTYYVVLDTRNFEEVGKASWYGNKFHGRKTSNGEIYDMYAMSAAHKTLPIPCFVEVTNLANNKTVTVRVNDRGPFHGDRIIDLSYTAAKKLGYYKKGTADVKIRVVNTSHGDKSSGKDVKRTYLQLGAFSQRESAAALKKQVGEVTGYPVLIKHQSSRKLYRVLVGPLLDNFELLRLRKKLTDKKIADAHVVEM